MTDTDIKPRRSRCEKVLEFIINCAADGTLDDALKWAYHDKPMDRYDFDGVMVTGDLIRYIESDPVHYKNLLKNG